MSSCQLFLKRSSGTEWSDLTVPDGKHFGIQPQGATNAGRWHSALSFEYASPKNFDVLPICSGTLFCDFRPRSLHFNVSQFDLMHLSKLGSQFVKPVVEGNYERLKLLPFPEGEDERVALFHSIENLDGKIKLILQPDTPVPLKPLGDRFKEFGEVKYFCNCSGIATIMPGCVCFHTKL